MNKNFLQAVIFILLIAFLLIYFVKTSYGSEYESPMQIYKPNYFIFGDNQDQVKFQISAKYNLIYPSDIGLWLGYTQKAFWHLYSSSSPFWEFNHEPEIFYCYNSKKNIFDYSIPYIDYITLSPFWHKSNGRDGEFSRSINCYYGEVQASVGQKINIGTIIKVFGYYNKAEENPDIAKYMGYTEGTLFITLKSQNTQFFDKEYLYIKGGGNFKSQKGWYEAGLKIRLLTTLFQPFFYLQFFQGYGETMVNYNKKDTALRAGLIFQN
jgi:phospholipase A1